MLLDASEILASSWLQMAMDTGPRRLILAGAGDDTA
jgi:hypothetical protein